MGRSRIQIVVGEVLKQIRSKGHDVIEQGRGVYEKVAFVDWLDRTTDERFRVFEGDQIPETINKQRGETDR